jgi:hypothetical protein
VADRLTIETEKSPEGGPMKQLMTMSLAVAVSLLLLCGPVAAQYPFPNQPYPYGNQLAPYQRPTVSPYLGLFAGNANPALNYYNIVRPNMYYPQAIGSLQQQIYATQTGMGTMDQTVFGPAMTGHAFGFQTQARYFQNLGLQAGGLGRTTVGQTTPFAGRSQSGIGTAGLGLSQFGTGMGAMTGVVGQYGGGTGLGTGGLGMRSGGSILGR